MPRTEDKYPIFLPMPGIIAVKQLEETTYGHLVLPPSAQRSRVLGTVIAIGGDQDDGDFYDLKEGDEVLFGQNSGIQVSVDGSPVVLLRTGEILARLQWRNSAGEITGRPKSVFAERVADPDEDL